MLTKTITAVYRNGSLKLKRKLSLPNNTTVILTWNKPADLIEATQGTIRVPRKVVLELTAPHKHSFLDL